MFCNSCGEKIKDGEPFCAKCGNPSKPPESAPETESFLFVPPSPTPDAAPDLAAAFAAKMPPLNIILIGIIAVLLVAVGFLVFRKPEPTPEPVKPAVVLDSPADVAAVNQCITNYLEGMIAGDLDAILAQTSLSGMLSFMYEFSYATNMEEFLQKNRYMTYKILAIKTQDDFASVSFSRKIEDQSEQMITMLLEKTNGKWLISENNPSNSSINSARLRRALTNLEQEAPQTAAK